MSIDHVIRCLLAFLLVKAVLCDLKGSTWTYPVQNFYPSDYQAGIQNIDFAQNRDMQLFVANNLGVLAYDGERWEVHAYKTGKKHRSLAFDPTEDRLYAGSQGDFGYFRGNWEYVSLAELIPGPAIYFDDVWDIFIDEEGVYFCTLQHIFHYDGESVRVLSLDGGFERAFYVSGQLFCQSALGALYEIQGQEINLVTQPLYEGVLAGMVSLEDGFMLIYNSGDVAYMGASDSFRERGTLSEVLMGTYVNHVLQLSDARLVISTQRQGLFVYDLYTSSVERLSIQEGLQSNTCLRTFQDFEGNIWVGQQSGISLIHVNSPMRLTHRQLGLEGSGYAVLETDKGSYYTTSNGIYFSPVESDRASFLTGTEGPAYGLTTLAGIAYAGHHNGLYRLDGATATLIVPTKGMWQVKSLRSHPDFVVGGTYEGIFLMKLLRSGELEPIGQVEGFDESSRFLKKTKTVDW